MEGSEGGRSKGNGKNIMKRRSDKKHEWMEDEVEEDVMEDVENINSEDRVERDRVHGRGSEGNRNEGKKK